MWKAVARRAFILTTLVACVELGILFLRRTWPVDLVNSFYVQRLGLEAILLLIWFRLQKRSLSYWLVPATIGLVHLYLFISHPSSTPHSTPPPSKVPRAMRVISFNVLSSNLRKESVVEWVASQADRGNTIVFLMEVNQEWAVALAPLKSKFASFKVEPREDNFGLALLSTKPLGNVSTLSLDPYDLPSFAAELDLNGEKLSFIGVHTFPPIDANGFHARNVYLKNLNELAAKQANLTIVAGDFNATPWSSYLKDFGERGGERFLYPSEGSYFRSATWFELGPVFGIPIDHVFHSARLVPTQFEIGPDLGSDHRPVMVDFSF